MISPCAWLLVFTKSTITLQVGPMMARGTIPSALEAIRGLLASERIAFGPASRKGIGHELDPNRETTAHSSHGGLDIEP